MKPDRREFMARRADLLSFLHLTDRADMVVDRLASREPGTDFRVMLAENGVPTDKTFRVLFKGIPGRVSCADELNRVLKRDFRSGTTSDPALPLCVFVFTMGDDRGYYGWLQEPVAGARRGLRMRKSGEVCWRDLDERGMEEIVDAVNAWYDAQRQAQAA